MSEPYAPVTFSSLTVRPLLGHRPNWVVFSPDSTTFATDGEQSTITVHSTASPEECITITPAELGAEFNWVDSLAYDPSGRLLAIAAGCVEESKSFVACFDIGHREVVALHQINDERCRQVVFSDGLIIFQDPDEDLAALDPSTGRTRRLFQRSWRIDDVTPQHFRSEGSVFRYTPDGIVTHLFNLNPKFDGFQADSCSLLCDGRLLLFGAYGISEVKSRPVQKYWVIECHHGDWKEIDTLEFAVDTYAPVPFPCWYTRHVFYLKQRALVLERQGELERIDLSSVLAPGDRCLQLFANADVDRLALIMLDRLLLLDLRSGGESNHR